LIKFYFWPTPNGYKISILLQELGLPYEVEAVHIGKGEQFDEKFLRISPNNKIPAIVDSEGPEGKPFSLFESASHHDVPRGKERLPLYAGKKIGPRYQVTQWLAFQAASMAPALGQAHHFREYSKEKIPYAIDPLHVGGGTPLSCAGATAFSESEFIAGEYSHSRHGGLSVATVTQVQGQNHGRLSVDTALVQRSPRAPRGAAWPRRSEGAVRKEQEAARGRDLGQPLRKQAFGRPSGGSSSQ